MRKLRLGQPRLIPLLPSVALFHLGRAFPDPQPPSVLSKHVGIEKANLTAVVQMLQRQRLVKVSQSEVDRRGKLIELTESGKEAVDQMIDLDHRICRAGLRGLDQIEVVQLGHFFDLLASALGVPNTPVPTAYEPVVWHQTRLSQGLGMVGSYLETGIEIGEYQLLRILNEQVRPVTLKELGRAVPMDRASLSRAVHRLHRRRLLSRKSSSSDGRAVLVSLTPKGINHYTSLSSTALLHLGAALAKIRGSEITGFIRIGNKIKLHSFVAQLAPSISIEKCDTDLSLRKAREFVVRELATSKGPLELGAELLPLQATTLVASNEEGAILAIATDTPPIVSDQDPWVLCASTPFQGDIRCRLIEMIKKLPP